MRILRQLMAVGAMAVAIAATAAPLTPEQALDAVRNGSLNGPMRAKASSMKLAYTLDGTQGPALYVFTPASTDGKGFIIASADDNAKALLAYSEESTFDATNIPPHVQWWLNTYTNAIQHLAVHPESGWKMNLAAPAAAGAKMSAPKTASHPAITTICKTTWDQDAPYYNQCPTIGSRRCYTGCVATAMAQIMKVFEWPTTGTGSHSYTFEYNNRNYSDSFNFGTTTFQWSNMLNSYNSGSYTTAQGNAVATLMHACGVASEMSYGPDGSGTMEYTAAGGMIDYLGYDAAMACMNRDWYTADGWDELVYGELALGRPVMYCGANSSNEGHAFICDGYNGSGYYHFNWGWSGSCDGYFLLSDPNPEDTGIGGGSGSSGFKYEMTAMVGTQPAQPGSVRPILVSGGKLSADKTSYTRNTSTYITITTSDSYHYNYSTFDINGYDGFGLIAEDGSKSFVIGSTLNLQMLNYYKSLKVKTSDLPIGTYYAYPAVSLNGSDWTRFRYDPTKCKGYFKIVVTSSTVTLSAGTTDRPDPDDAPLVNVIADLTAGTPDNDIFYMGEDYDLTFSFTGDGAFNDTYYAVMYDTQHTETITSQTKTEDFESAEGFSSSVDGWTFVDKDGAVVGGVQNVTIPGFVSGSTTGSYWVWDLDEVSLGGASANSGSKFLFTMYNSDASANNDWAISPELSGEAQTISLYAKSYSSSYGYEQMNIYTSTGSTNPSNFTLLSGSTKSLPTDWTKYQFNLPAGTKRFAIVCTSQDVFMMFVDDVTFKTAGGEVISSFALRTSPAMNVSSTAAGTVNSNWTLSVPNDLDIETANRYQLHICKKSGNEMETVKAWNMTIRRKGSGIETITDAEGAKTLYDLQGLRVVRPQKGSVYIERTADGKTRKVVF